MKKIKTCVNSYGNSSGMLSQITYTIHLVYKGEMIIFGV